MNGSAFDSMTRRFATRLSRRHLLSFTALGAATALGVRAGHSEVGAQSDASTLVQRFYENVDAYQYEQAYALLGSAWHARQSLEDFTNGYSNTAFVQCETTGEGASGSSTIVSVELISWHNDGTIVGYTGQYTVGEENGQLLILGGNNAVTAAPEGTPPLCTIDDLSLSFGPWQGAAGSRIGSIVGTNRSTDTCALGGSPRVLLVDQSWNVLISTSEEGSPPVAIYVGAGESAQAPLSFSNWCGDTSNPLLLGAMVPGDSATGEVSEQPNGISYPPCNGPGQSARIAIKGWVSS
jgi:Domain of unknown function (DUF4232)